MADLVVGAGVYNPKVANPIPVSVNKEKEAPAVVKVELEKNESSAGKWVIGAGLTALAATGIYVLSRGKSKYNTLEKAYYKNLRKLETLEEANSSNLRRINVLEETNSTNLSEIDRLRKLLDPVTEKNAIRDKKLAKLNEEVSFLSRFIDEKIALNSAEEAFAKESQALRKELYKFLENNNCKELRKMRKSCLQEMRQLREGYNYKAYEKEKELLHVYNVLLREVAKGSNSMFIPQVGNLPMAKVLNGLKNNWNTYHLRRVLKSYDANLSIESLFKKQCNSYKSAKEVVKSRRADYEKWLKGLDSEVHNGQDYAGHKFKQLMGDFPTSLDDAANRLKDVKKQISELESQTIL